MHDKLEKIWKKVVVIWPTNYSVICLQQYLTFLVPRTFYRVPLILQIPSPKLPQVADPLGAIRVTFEVCILTHKKGAIETFIMSMLQLITKSINFLVGER